jgi:hypothetical protein
MITRIGNVMNKHAHLKYKNQQQKKLIWEELLCTTFFFFNENFRRIKQLPSFVTYLLLTNWFSRKLAFERWK